MNHLFDVPNTQKKSVQSPKGKKKQQHTQKYCIIEDDITMLTSTKGNYFVLSCCVVENTKHFVTFRETAKK